MACGIKIEDIVETCVQAQDVTLLVQEVRSRILIGR